MSRTERRIPTDAASCPVAASACAALRGIQHSEPREPPPAHAPRAPEPTPLLCPPQPPREESQPKPCAASSCPDSRSDNSTPPAPPTRTADSHVCPGAAAAAWPCPPPALKAAVPHASR